MHKVIGDTDRVGKEHLFLLVKGSVTRGHRFKVRGRKFRGDVRKNFYLPRGGDGLQCAAGEGGGCELSHIL